MTIKLNFPINSWDQDNTFSFVYKNWKNQDAIGKGELFDGEEDGIWIMKIGACVKSNYTDKDREEKARLQAMTPLRTGDIVELEGKTYTVQINGDYSNAGKLIPA